MTAIDDRANPPRAPAAARWIVGSLMVLVPVVILPALLPAGSKDDGPDLDPRLLARAVRAEGSSAYLQVNFRDEDGRAVESGKAELHARCPEGNRATSHRTDIRHGVARFGLCDENAVEYWLEARDAVDEQGRRLGAVRAGPFSPRDVPKWITLPPGRSISGRLVDEEGRPVAGVEVRAEPAGAWIPFGQVLSDMAGRDPHATATSGWTGCFTLTGLGPGPYSIVPAKHSGIRPYPLVVPSGATDVRLVLRDRASILRAGRSTLGDCPDLVSLASRAERAHIAGNSALRFGGAVLRVRPTGHRETDRGPARLIPAGEPREGLHLTWRLDLEESAVLLFEGLQADGKYDLWIGPTEDGLSCYLRGISPGAGVVDVELSAGETIRGTAVLASGRGARQVSVVHRNFAVWGKIRDDGEFAIPGLPPGPWMVLAEDWVDGRYLYDSVRARPGRNVSMNPVFDPSHVCNLRLDPDTAGRTEVIEFLIGVLSSDDPRVRERYVLQRVLEIGHANRALLLEESVVDTARRWGRFWQLLNALLLLRDS